MRTYNLCKGGRALSIAIGTLLVSILMLLVVAFPVSATVQASTVEMRGTVVSETGAQSWDAQNFAGFFYDMKNNISTEQLHIDTTIPGADLSSLNTNRSIPEKALIYSTNPKLLQFMMNEQQNVTVDNASTYDVVGWQAEKWVAVNNVGNKLVKLVFEMEKNDKKTLTTGETWSLGAGYELTINAINARATPRQVLFTLKKDGAVIDEGIGQPPASETTADKQKAVYYKTKTILNESDSLLFTVYVVSIFSGATSDLVQFKYAWLIDESSAKEIQGSDDYGVFEVTQANTNGITMDNKNTVNLSRNSETTLMGNLKFKIADNDTLRFYPMITYTDPGTYEVRGTVADASVPTSNTTYASWNAQSFAGFFYDIKNNISTESLDLLVPLGSLQLTRTIPEKQLLYSTGKAAQQFKANDKEGVNVAGSPTYSVVGWQAEKWIAVNDSTNKIAKLAFEMDKEDKKTLRTGETWSLGSGYELTINDIYARATPRQVLFTLKKDGTVIDEGIGQLPASESTIDKQKAVYYKTKTILGESDSLLFTVYVDSIFSGATSDMVQFKYAWLIDESSAKQIQGSDEFGAFEVQTATDKVIILDNKNSINLSKNTETTLMGNMNFRIADSDILRFYPKIEYIITQTPVLTTITVSPTNATVFDGNTKTYIATTLDQNGIAIDAIVIWSSSNHSVGTIASTGVFTAVAAGTTTITAKSGDVSGTVTVTVMLPEPLLVFAITPTAGMRS